MTVLKNSSLTCNMCSARVLGMVECNLLGHVDLLYQKELEMFVVVLWPLYLPPGKEKMGRMDLKQWVMQECKKTHSWSQVLQFSTKKLTRHNIFFKRETIFLKCILRLHFHPHIVICFQDVLCRNVRILHGYKRWNTLLIIVAKFSNQKSNRCL